MKLRIKGNSLRLRLTQGEIKLLESTHRVEESISFLDGDKNKLTYIIESNPGLTEPKAFLEGHRIIVSLPNLQVEQWIGSDQVGIEYLQPLDADRHLRVLVEKDFACLKPRENEDDSDAYPNPDEETGANC